MKKTIVKTDNYLLIVDDSEIKKGDLILTPYGKVVKALDVHTTKFTRVGTALNDCQKIIAHLPLNDSPVLEGVMLLPPFTHFEFEMEDELAIDGHTIIGRNPKTTTNSQGQEVACGKYVYAS